jgi:Flp pilus assembly pilin Flp
MEQLLRRFRSRETGSALTEYALIIAAVALGLVAVLAAFRNSVGDLTNRTAVTISHQSGSGYGSGGGAGRSPGGSSPVHESPTPPDSSGGDSTATASAFRAFVTGRR